MLSDALLNMLSVAKILIFFYIPTHFWKISYGLIENCMFEGSTLLIQFTGFCVLPYEEVGLREAFVGDDEAQGVHTGQGLSAVRSLLCIYHRLPCRWLARGEVESSKHHKSDSPNLLCFHLFRYNFDVNCSAWLNAESRKFLHRWTLNVFKVGSVGARPTTAHRNERDL